MPKCCQCGKDCGTQISFNWNGGVAYLCSENVEKNQNLGDWHDIKRVKNHESRMFIMW